MKITWISITVLLFAATGFASDIFSLIDREDSDGIRLLVSGDRSLLNSKNKDGLTPLNYAASCGKTKSAGELIQLGSDIKIGDYEDSLPIHNAAVAGSNAVIEMLLKAGADINSQDMNGMTPLHFACDRQKLDIIKYLVEKGADVNIGNKNGITPLMYCFIRNIPEGWNYLIDLGAQLDRKSSFPGTPLHYATAFGRTDAVQLILNKKINPDLEDTRGETALMWANNVISFESAQLLIQNGANIMHRSQYGVTPLHSVAQRGNLPVVDLLLQKGANPNAMDNNGFTVLNSAVLGRHIDVITHLLLAGAEINPVNKCSANETTSRRVTHPKEKNTSKAACSCSISRIETPLHIAAELGEMDIVKLLVDNGAKINILDKNGMTPLHNAVFNGKKDVVDYLISKGAFTHVKESHWDRSELTTAVIQGQTEIVGSLIRCHADLNTKDALGKNPVEYAFEHGFSRIGYQLLAQGADDSCIANVVQHPNHLTRETQDGEAVIWSLGHAGWAVKTSHHLMIFDYAPRPDEAPVDQAGLLNGHINPQELRNMKVDVFVTHTHADHYNSSIFQWRNVIPNIQYIFGVRPVDTTSECIILSPRIEDTIDDMKITTCLSTDAGVAFLVETDGVSIFQAGDLSCGRPDLEATFQKEINFIQSKANSIDIAFMPVIGCGLGDKQMVRDGVVWAVQELSPKFLIPEHAGIASYDYKDFADWAESKNLQIPIHYAIDRGDVFLFQKNELRSL